MLNKLFSKGFNSAPIPESGKDVEVVLDSQQKSVVYSSSNNTVVIAGAGSGKTRVLTERVKHLLNSGVPPHNIVAITFTNLAAEEMKERLKNVDGIGDAFIGTIHSFANRLMKLSGEKYTLYNDDIDCKYHKYLIQKYCKFLTFERFLEHKDIQALAEIGKVSERELSEYFTPSEHIEYNMLHRSPKEIKAEIEYKGETDYAECIISLCERDGVIHFDELLRRADKYFRSINARVEHLLVDEFQDVGSLEFKFLEGLNAVSNFFVGDDYQSIFGFKGGNVSLFLRLVEDSDFEVHYLTNNYRNSTRILSVADTVISQVKSKVTKSITPKVDTEGEVIIKSRGRVREVLHEIKQSKDFKDWFILTRTNKELYTLSEMCEDLGIPYTTFRREGLTLADLRRNMNSNRVKILTVHTSKGLESKNVLLYGKFPVISPMFLNEEEERKVMYVGVTRAENKLVILN